MERIKGVNFVEHNTKIYVTQEGYNQYITALEDLKRKQAEHMRTRAEYGKNEVENYQTGVYDDELRTINSAIRDAVETIAHLVIIEKEQLEDGIIGLDDIVTVQYLDTGDIKRMKITGGMPNLGKDEDYITITVNSPVGKALYKSKVGDTVTFKVRDNTIAISIISKETASNSKVQEKQPLDD